MGAPSLRNYRSKSRFDVSCCKESGHSLWMSGLLNEKRHLNVIFFRNVKKSISHQLKSHPAVALLAESTGKSLFSAGAEQGALGGDPHAVRDALLTYVCHGSGLPCETPTNCIK